MLLKRGCGGHAGFHRHNMEVLGSQHSRNMEVLQAQHRRNMANLTGLHRLIDPYAAAGGDSVDSAADGSGPQNHAAETTTDTDLPSSAQSAVQTAAQANTESSPGTEAATRTLLGVAEAVGVADAAVQRSGQSSGSSESSVAAASEQVPAGASCTAQAGPLAELRSAAAQASCSLYEFTLNTRTGQVRPQGTYYCTGGCRRRLRKCPKSSKNTIAF